MKRGAIGLLLCVGAACTKEAPLTSPDGGIVFDLDAAPGAPDAEPGAPDARPAPDAAPGTPDAAPGTPDAGPGAPDAGPVSGALTRVFATRDATLIAHSATVRGDAQGVIHVVYIDNKVTGSPLVYGVCASGCDSPTSWTFTELATTGFGTSRPMLAVDPAGRPRVLYVHDESNSEVRYTECNANCTQAASWTTLVLGPLTRFDDCGWGKGRPFGVDAQGRPRFAYCDTSSLDNSGLFYATCDGDCTGAGWRATRLSDSYSFDELSLALDTQGRPRLAFVSFDQANTYLAYAECDAGCDVAASWSSLVLLPLGTTHRHALALDPSGRPRLALYGGQGQGIGALTLLGCDAACATPEGWQGVPLDVPATAGADGVDLALDAAGAAFVAYLDAAVPARVGVIACGSACQGAIFDDDETMEADWDRPRPFTCNADAWFEGKTVDILLRSGQPVVAFNPEHTSLGGPACTPAYRDAYAVRLAGALQ